MHIWLGHPEYISKDGKINTPTWDVDEHIDELS